MTATRWAGLRAPALVGLLVAAVGILAVTMPRPPAFLTWKETGLRDEHDALAVNLVRHGRYSAHLEDPGIATVARGPLYPFYLAGIYRVFGILNLRAVRIGDQVVHALSAALLVAALQAFIPAVAAAAGGLLYAFWPTTFYYVAKGGSETVQILMLAASLFFLVALRRRPGIAPAIALGACMAGACLGRGNAAVLLLIFAAWAAVAVARRALPLRVAGAVVLAWALTMTPWWIHNLRATGEFVPFHTLLWFNAYHDDVFDDHRRLRALRGEVDRDVIIGYPPLEEAVQHPPGTIMPTGLPAREDVAQERLYRRIMLEKYREPGYLAGKMARNAVDFWSAGGKVANDRTLLVTSLAWLALFFAGLALALRDAELRWCAWVCFAYVALTWMLYLPIVALFRYNLPTAPFVAATIALGIGAALRGRVPGPAGRPPDRTT